MIDSKVESKHLTPIMETSHRHFFFFTHIPAKSICRNANKITNVLNVYRTFGDNTPNDYSVGVFL